MGCGRMDTLYTKRPRVATLDAKATIFDYDSATTIRRET